MSELPVQVSVTRRFEQSAERVFDAWLDPATAGRWLFATPEGQMQRVEVDPRVGGTFTIVEKRGGEEASHHGTYVAIDRPRRLAFRFTSARDDPNPSLVTVAIEADGSGCSLTLTHDIDQKWADLADRVRQGWEMILGNLAARLEEK
jgi:uncharacterized protein YndB with AHSA1/START domain